MRAGPSQRRFEQRRIHDSAFAGDIAMLQRRQRADYRPHRGADVDDRHADPRRRPVWIAVDAENAAEGLRTGSKAGSMRIGPRLPKPEISQ